MSKKSARRRTGYENQLTNAETEKLLQEVKARPSLWNDRHEDFKQFKVTKALWDEVGAALDMPAEETKKKWKNLKDRYRKVLQTPYLKTRRGKQIPNPWRFADSMRFTRDVLLPSVNQGNDDTDDEHKNVQDDVENVFEEMLNRRDHDYESTTQNSPVDNRRVRTTRKSSIHNRYGLRRRQVESIVFEDAQNLKRNATQLESDKTEAVQNIQTKEKKTEEDDDYYFLMSLHPFLKPLPPFEKLDLRGRLLSQVMETYKNREQQINENPHTFNSSENCQIFQAEPITLIEYHQKPDD